MKLAIAVPLLKVESDLQYKIRYNIIIVLNLSWAPTIYSSNWHLITVKEEKLLPGIVEQRTTVPAEERMTCTQVEGSFFKDVMKLECQVLGS